MSSTGERLRRLSTILLGGCVIWLLTSCGGDVPSGTAASTFTPTVASVFAMGPADGVPAPSPFTGLVLWSTNASLSTYARAIQLEFGEFTYDQVASGDPTNGWTYDWSPITAFLASAAARGHHGIVRFIDTSPEFTHPGLPASLLTNVRTATYDEAIAGSSAKTVYFPDWANANYPAFYVAFYAAFASTFDADPRLAYLEAGFGLWSEYHVDFANMTNFSDTSITTVGSALGKIFPDRPTQFQILTAIDQNVVRTPWLVSVGTASTDYASFSTDPTWMNLGFGLFDDSFLDAGGNAADWAVFTKSAATINGGEISYYTTNDQTNALAPNGPNGVSLASAARTRALTFLIGNNQVSYRSPSELAVAGRSLGYHLRVTAFVPGSTTTSVQITNTGVAKVPFDIYPALGVTASTQSLRGLAPGATATVVINAVAPSGLLAMTSPKLLPGQVIPYDGY